ncbi:MAG: hypothetical protein KatS3mg076_2061 [Candidatus Binatia bacterium]|nr:MAG: hypothetical protein KatS3mg076_2061 [Candidatus Binatia bacterium]
MKYPAVKRAVARTALATLSRGPDAYLEETVETRGDGPEFDWEVVRELERELETIKKRYPESLGIRDERGGQFEAEACAIVHHVFRDLEPDILADREFWVWLALIPFRTLVMWRHAGKPAPDNFGTGSAVENFLFRMWLRADAGYDEGKPDPYEISKMGDQDFWRSHILRQDYGRCRPLVRALVKYQFANGTKRMRDPQIRELAKLLRRLHANVIFDFLTEEEARDLVHEMAERAARSLAD